MSMRVLTVRQPWAEAIARLGKDVENRSWPTSYRGPLAIHAGRTLDRDAVLTVERLYGLRGVLPARFQGGSVVALADLVDVHPASECLEQQSDGDWLTCSTWAERVGHHWVLADVRPLTAPFDLVGTLGLRVLPADFEREILARVA